MNGTITIPKLCCPNERNEMTIVIMTEHGDIIYAVISLNGVEIPDAVFQRMRGILEFDIINEYCRSKCLLEHLRETKQKVQIVGLRTRNYDEDLEKIKLSQWKDVFQF